MPLGIDVLRATTVDDLALGHHHESLTYPAHQIQMLFDDQHAGARRADLIENAGQFVDQHRR
jgi:hypothetical protein